MSKNLLKHASSFAFLRLCGKGGGGLSFTFSTTFAFGHSDFHELSTSLCLTYYGTNSSCTSNFFFEALSTRSLQLHKVISITYFVLSVVSYGKLPWVLVFMSELVSLTISLTSYEPLANF